MVEATVLTWNVQGSRGVDVASMAAIIRAVGADVVALQEIKRRQAGALAAVLTMTSRRWVFKHWPLRMLPEGLAVLSPHRIVTARSFRLHRAPFWSWKRRVGLDITVDVDGHELRVIAIHLSSQGGAAQLRAREAGLVTARAGSSGPAPVIVGDLNDGPDLSAPAELVRAGWIDAWVAANGADGGATNWTSGDRTGRPPTQRLDYVFAPPGAVVGSCTVPVDRVDEVARLSDHLPVVATVRLP